MSGAVTYVEDPDEWCEFVRLHIGTTARAAVNPLGGVALDVGGQLYAFGKRPIPATFGAVGVRMSERARAGRRAERR